MFKEYFLKKIDFFLNFWMSSLEQGQTGNKKINAMFFFTWRQQIQQETRQNIPLPEKGQFDLEQRPSLNWPYDQRPPEWPSFDLRGNRGQHQIRLKPGSDPDWIRRPKAGGFDGRLPGTQSHQGRPKKVKRLYLEDFNLSPRRVLVKRLNS